MSSRPSTWGIAFLKELVYSFDQGSIQFIIHHNLSFYTMVFARKVISSAPHELVLTPPRRRIIVIAALDVSTIVEL